ncbi:hypothetical protein CRG98_027903 [Punica granatum]|uniref:pectinesterase n=1 Tax=Punica granatum TaxID=22663 RepID=A0A2I0J769_PUNGR|nr:hypothetical protein CRG98_027903 [Punica granatum]
MEKGSHTLGEPTGLIPREKLTIRREKPFIYLEGEGGPGTTSIKWDDHGHVDSSYTFTLLVENFLASRITFKNTYNLGSERSNPVAVAPAILIWGDKAVFYNCKFLSLQDTLADFTRRHLFDSCYIEGGMDFMSTLTYVESNCSGPGSNISSRVSWLKTLTPEQLENYLDPTKFIDQDEWVEAQPVHN